MSLSDFFSFSGLILTMLAPALCIGLQLFPELRLAKNFEFSRKSRWKWPALIIPVVSTAYFYTGFWNKSGAEQNATAFDVRMMLITGCVSWLLVLNYLHCISAGSKASEEDVPDAPIEIVYNLPFSAWIFLGVAWLPAGYIALGPSDLQPRQFASLLVVGIMLILAGPMLLRAYLAGSGATTLFSNCKLNNKALLYLQKLRSWATYGILAVTVFSITGTTAISNYFRANLDAGYEPLFSGLSDSLILATTVSSLVILGLWIFGEYRLSKQTMTSQRE